MEFMREGDPQSNKKERERISEMEEIRNLLTFIFINSIFQAKLPG